MDSDDFVCVIPARDLDRELGVIEERIRAADRELFPELVQKVRKAVKQLVVLLGIDPLHEFNQTSAKKMRFTISRMKGLEPIGPELPIDLGSVGQLGSVQKMPRPLFRPPLGADRMLDPLEQ